MSSTTSSNDEHVCCSTSTSSPRTNYRQAVWRPCLGGWRRSHTYCRIGCTCQNRQSSWWLRLLLWQWLGRLYSCLHYSWSCSWRSYCCWVRAFFHHFWSKINENRTHTVGQNQWLKSVGTGIGDIRTQWSQSMSRTYRSEASHASCYERRRMQCARDEKSDVFVNKSTICNYRTGIYFHLLAYQRLTHQGGRRWEDWVSWLVVLVCL